MRVSKLHISSSKRIWYLRFSGLPTREEQKSDLRLGFSGIKSAFYKLCSWLRPCWIRSWTCDPRSSVSLVRAHRTGQGDHAECPNVRPLSSLLGGRLDGRLYS